MPTIEIAQGILNGKWQHAPAALRACQRGDWPEFIRKAAPARPLLFGRFDYGRCLKMAARSLMGPETIKLTLVPLWACSTEERCLQPMGGRARRRVARPTTLREGNRSVHCHRRRVAACGCAVGMHSSALDGEGGRGGLRIRARPSPEKARGGFLPSTTVSGSGCWIAGRLHYVIVCDHTWICSTCGAAA